MGASTATRTQAPSLGEMRRAVATLRAFSEHVEPGTVGARAAKALIEDLGAATKLCGAITTLLVERVAATNVWSDGGARTPAEWVARANGVPLGQAIGMVETAARLPELPATESALRSGELSPAQARIIAETAAVAPAAEADLLETASRSSVRWLTERARVARAAADPVAAERRHERARCGRDLRTWVDESGAGRLSWSGTVDALTRLKHDLAPYVRAQLTAARAAGRDERYGACAADALLAMAAAASSPDGRRPVRPAAHEVLVRADLHELARPHATPHELATIEGGGPIPDAVFAAILDEHPLVRVAITSGRDVRTIAHLGRRHDAYLRSALLFRDPVCVVDGCECTTGLEEHHVIAVADGGGTSLENVVRICSLHHDRITYDGGRLVGSHRDGWRLEPP